MVHFNVYDTVPSPNDKKREPKTQAPQHSPEVMDACFVGDFLTFLHRFLPGARNEERPLALQQEPLSRPMPRALRCFPRQVIYEL